jgi:S-adenosylmethionine:tRNA ribosyltransferase-isomerase
MATNRIFPHIHLSDFEYELPEAYIAKFPLTDRSSSRLLLYKEGNIEHQRFYEIEQALDNTHTLFFNNTKVIPARLYFQKETGAIIEVFLLQPLDPVEVHLAMIAKGKATWACAIGNLKRWKDYSPLLLATDYEGETVHFKAYLVDREKQIVRFEWENERSFSEILALIGNMPLPPYLKRAAEDKDNQQYQTVYAQNQGAVAAPTAGLHFTPELLQKLQAKGVKQSHLTLHVGGGTFQPIRTETIEEHNMHSEQVPHFWKVKMWLQLVQPLCVH